VGDFIWKVSRSGYLWDFVNCTTTRSTVRGLVTLDTGEGVREYRPLEDCPDLFVEFAALTTSPNRLKGALEFAAKYGHLTKAVAVQKAMHYRGDWVAYCGRAVRHGNAPIAVEPVTDPSRCEFGFPDLRDQLAAVGPSAGGLTAHTKPHAKHRQERWTDWDFQIYEMGLAVDQWRTNGEHPCATVVAALRRKIEAILTGRVGFAFDPKTGWPSHVPTDLLSAMWLQLARAIAANRQYRDCKQCGTLFPLYLPGRRGFEEEVRSRSDKKYCSDQCRYNADYAAKKFKRQAAAVESKRTKSSKTQRASGVSG
jgi:hypothetical protein